MRAQVGVAGERESRQEGRHHDQTGRHRPSAGPGQRQADDAQRGDRGDPAGAVADQSDRHQPAVHQAERRGDRDVAGDDQRAGEPAGEGDVRRRSRPSRRTQASAATIHGREVGGDGGAEGDRNDPDALDGADRHRRCGRGCGPAAPAAADRPLAAGVGRRSRRSGPTPVAHCRLSTVPPSCLGERSRMITVRKNGAACRPCDTTPRYRPVAACPPHRGHASPCPRMPRLLGSGGVAHPHGRTRGE